jgi:hypothetical protein
MLPEKDFKRYYRNNMKTWGSWLGDKLGGHEYEILYDEDQMVGIICKLCDDTITFASYMKKEELKRLQDMVGPGWAGLVEQAYAFACTRGVILTDVKEKYGTLRIYTDYYDDDIETVLELIDWKSAHTCEKCGRPGKPRRTGWIKTLCFQHYIGVIINRAWWNFKHHFLIPNIVNEINKFFEEKNNEK